MKREDEPNALGYGFNVGFDWLSVDHPRHVFELCKMDKSDEWLGFILKKEYSRTRDICGIDAQSWG